MVEIIVLCVFTTTSPKLNAKFLLALTDMFHSSYVPPLLDVGGRLYLTRLFNSLPLSPLSSAGKCLEYFCPMFFKYSSEYLGL